MTKAQNLLRLNFAAFDKKWFLNYAYTQLREGWVITDWKKEILYFIIDWLSQSDEMKSTTSGSTGTPKTMKLKKEFVVNSAKATNQFFGLKKGDTALLCLPVKYIAGKLMIIRAMEQKMNLYCVEPSLEPSFDEAVIDFAAMTPAQVTSLLETKEGTQLLENIDKLIIGGDAVSSVLENRLQKLKTNVWNSYGMTETITHIALRKVNGKDASPFFKPLPSVSLSLASDECLIIDAPNIGVRQMKTNDIAEIFQDGSFKIKGRKDNVVISGGVKLFPEEIEKKLSGICEHPFYFTGVEDEKLGSKLIIVIETRVEINTNELLELFRTKLDKFEIPKEFILVKEFVRTKTGKVKRVFVF